MSDKFHVGQKVVCIYDGNWNDKTKHKNGVVPVKGAVYEIGKITELSASKTGIVLWLVELPNAYESHVFRPVRTTDISIFTAMLAPTPRVKQPV